MDLGVLTLPSAYKLIRADSVSDIKSSSDEILISLIAKGNEAAFSVLLDRHLPRVLSIATRLIGNTAEADDIAQEAMMRVWTRGSLWRPGTAKFSTWLHRIVVNLCIDRMRRRQFHPLDEAETIPDARYNPLKDTENALLKDAVEAALNSLPGNQKTAIVLCHYEGFSGKEAAKILGLSVLAVQSLLVRGRAKLRQSLSNFADFGDEP